MSRFDDRVLLEVFFERMKERESALRELRELREALGASPDDPRSLREIADAEIRRRVARTTTHGPRR